jgi:integrase
MAPNIRSHQLETRTQRAKLLVRRKPYSIRIAPGIRLGYRRNEGAGTWSVIGADGSGGAWLKRVAVADDHENADGKTVMTFWEATEAARKLARATDGVTNSERPVTVKEAIEAYKQDLIARDGNPWNATQVLAELTPALAARPVSTLSQKEIRAYRDGLIAKGLTRASVNRYMKSIVAGLNLAARLDARVANANAWKIPALPDSNKARNVILADAQLRNVVVAAYGISHEFGILVEVLATTGVRVSQAARAVVGDLLSDKIMMPSSRKGAKKKQVERRPVPIPPSLAAKLRTAVGDRPDDAGLLLRPNGELWAGTSHVYPFRLAVKAANLSLTDVSIYALRHTSIVCQILAGVPLRVVADVHDTSIAMIESNYSKHITSHADALVRRALPDFDVAPAADNVVAMKR